MHYRHVRHTLALMCAKNHLLIFSSFLDIWENVEWPRFFGPPCTFTDSHLRAVTDADNARHHSITTRATYRQ